MRELAPGIVAESWTGAAPVQIEGTVDGKRFYFRSRQSRYQFVVADTEDDAINATIGEPANYHFRVEGLVLDAVAREVDTLNEFGTFPASMMPMRQAEALVVRAVELWRLGRQLRGDDA